MQFRIPSHIFSGLAKARYDLQVHLLGSSDQSPQSSILSQNEDFGTHFPLLHLNSDFLQTKILKK